MPYDPNLDPDRDAETDLELDEIAGEEDRDESDDRPFFYA